jgi:hypothetical protein
MALVGLVDVNPRHSANHSIGRDFPCLLKFFDGALGLRPEDPIDGPGIKSQNLERLLAASGMSIGR